MEPKKALTREEMLARLRAKTPAELIEDCDRLLSLNEPFRPMPRSYALITLLRERLVKESQAQG